MGIVDQILAGDVRATARVLRDIDDQVPTIHPILKQLYPHTGKAFIIGFTGSPGVGKSTLVDQLTIHYRKQGLTVGILAVDPTSPFTGGAILGDRIRMQRHFLDDGVFIRSLATRGHFGGLTKSTNDMINVLDAMGKDIILVETVGVGQDEVEIANSAHTTVLVTIPGMGDEVQAIKAGIMEIGNIFVVNKADREGSRKTIRELMNLIELGLRHQGQNGWEPPIIQTEAIKSRGIEELGEAIQKHRDFLLANDKSNLRDVLVKRARTQLLEVLKEEALRTLMKRIETRGIALDTLVDQIVEKSTDPYSVVQDLLNNELP
ncbi:methylmalonyl Co-A mutase-associated GTPase MeaB [Desulfoferrobacter suflitae]|uniref:methylmalonyl Co-A mutase-associated GTPase MeaB n=1 Tax=Desulfoferrobacter suflitae TaxID=2865782 RepID=UPI002164E429|nr:methylmalonyl Co-A mutase-associated GTPase MeaB [Desulfoferrobacter suflitae]MCK8600865.1 methylmalonyl Co-A mutase-associated GTPase MeaB [Desulfoferrobacter suflitae]